MLLDLMDLGVDAPVGRIGIASLRADGDGLGRDRALFQPDLGCRRPDVPAADPGVGVWPAQYLRGAPHGAAIRKGLA
jgi:hypothetical protein